MVKIWVEIITLTLKVFQMFAIASWVDRQMNTKHGSISSSSVLCTCFSFYFMLQCIFFFRKLYFI